MVSTSRLILLTLLAASLPLPGQAAGRALETALVSRQGDAATIVVSLQCPHRYLDHEPPGAARRVRINLVPADNCALNSGSSTVREATRPAGRELAKLKELEYVLQGGATGYLSLQFSTAVNVQVSQRGDLRRLEIRVRPSDGIAESDTAIHAELDSPEDPLGSPAPDARAERRRRAEDRAGLARSKTEGVPVRGRYVVNLASSMEPVNAVLPSVTGGNDDWQFYTTATSVSGRQWHRLRLGFFATEAIAESVRLEVSAAYPQAWVTRIGADEHAIADSSPVSTSADPAVDAPRADSPIAAVTLSVEDADKLIDDGRAAIVQGDYPRAIQLLTRALQAPENARSAQALEMLALARERNGQRAHAVAEYRRYLALYPQGDAAARVNQRLAGLTAVATPERSPSGRRSPQRSARKRWRIFGGLSQYYRLDEARFGEQDSVTTQSSLLSDVDVIADREGDRFQFQSRVTAGNLYDLLSDDEGPGTSTRLYYLYADISDDRSGLGARLGRQTMRSAGVLGRFDGAHLSWQWRPELRFNLVTGLAVDSPGDSPDTDASFYGFSVDWLELADAFDVTFFYNEQEFDGLPIRQAVGAELRYYDAARTLIVNTDYDIEFGELNNLTMLGTWALENRVTFNALLDHRKSPFLTARNALIGQPVGALDELAQLHSEDELQQLALDRTGELNALTLGVALPLFERFHVNADVTVNDFTGTPASAGVPEMPDLDAQYYYSLNLVGSSLLKEGDSSILGLRYVDGGNTSTTSLFLETRYPATRGLRLNPRLRLTHREFAQGGSSEWSAVPSMRLRYRFARRYLLELEVGGTWSSRELESDTLDSSAYFLYAGYRADFQ
jgi:hypothetical protein